MSKESIFLKETSHVWVKIIKMETQFRKYIFVMKKNMCTWEIYTYFYSNMSCIPKDCRAVL